LSEVDLSAYQLTLEPVTQELVDALASKPLLHTLAPTESRSLFLRAQSAPVGKPVVRYRELTCPAGPTGSLRLRIVEPGRANGVLPVVMYFHGGGWVLGDADTHDRLVRELAVESGAALVLVDYDRSPEARYPVAIEQAYAATAYVVAHDRELGIDATRLAVVGDDVGATMATVVTLLAKERRGPRIDLQVLLCPVTDAGFDTPSYDAFAASPWHGRDAIRWFWDAYLPDVGRRREAAAAPLNASLDQLRYLPDALVVVAENDVVRDEGEAYASKLSDAGVRVTCVRYNGTIHDFATLNALADTPAARAAIAQVAYALRAALG
jgi:acetyl esterase